MGATQASAGRARALHRGDRRQPAARSRRPQSRSVRRLRHARTSSDSGVAVPYRRTGTLDVALQEGAMEKLRATAALLASRDVAAEIVDGHAARGEEPHLTADVDRRSADSGARVRRGRRSHTRARRLGAPPRHAGDRRGPRRPHRAGRRRHARRHRARHAHWKRRRARRGKLVGPDRHRRPRRARAGEAGARPAPASGLERRRAAPRDVERSLLPGSVGRWDAAGGGDGGGSRLRRARDGGRRARSARSGVRARAARVDGRFSRRARRAAAGDAGRSADHRRVGRAAESFLRDRATIETACCWRR